MKYGNCLIGALLLAWWLGSWRITTTRGTIRPDGRRSWVPHFLVEDRHGTVWHYKRVRDLLPYPFCFFLFEGQVEVYIPVDHSNYL